MSAGITAAPHTDPVRIDSRMVLQKGDRPAPIGDLNPWVDVEARRTVAGPKTAMVMHEHHEPDVGEQAGKSLQAVFLHAGEAVRHGDGRMWSRAVGHKQPAPQCHVTFDGELDILSPHCSSALLVPSRSTTSTVCALRPRR